ncbi:hypothetical protein FVP74_09355 [Microbacterium saccharophilum]|uniref:Uncharacterized protein n=1 Tax=Microbacterium saccharophilum TaxID=1213358 RepID=A0A5C8HYW8_9MICO|nr:hypothetical protein [Microbacterium saccharophilum]TXK11525.1 hypothetical protein FVP74_09355 [Microbacterium saccharophilum]GEP49079.1 hypothetical protein MSA03_25870 [Microbacterium saccharophilum]
MTTREALEARKEALEAELARREASRSTSERQAAYVTGRGRTDEPDDNRDDDREPAWGDDGERNERGSSASRRQAARITRGASRRGDS